MTRRASLDEKRARLLALRAQPEVVLEGLKERSAALVASAAQLAAEQGHRRLTPQLVAAFQRLLDNPVRSDPGCRAKTALLEALYRLEYSDPALYLTALGYRQHEPGYGGREDTAASLRGVAALGLVQSGYPEAALHLVELLVDPEKPTRKTAARALGCLGGQGCDLVLRLKVLQGDDPEVIGECFDALLQLSAEQAGPFVAGYLSHSELREAAATALGECRWEGAFERLKQAWDEAFEAQWRQVLLLSLAMLRQSRAHELLVRVIHEGDLKSATAALKALVPYLVDRQQVAEAVAGRGALVQLWERMSAGR